MIDGGCDTAQADLIGLQGGKRHCLEVKNVGPAVLAHDDRRALVIAIVSRHGALLLGRDLRASCARFAWPDYAALRL